MARFKVRAEISTIVEIDIEADSLQAVMASAKGGDHDEAWLDAAREAMADEDFEIDLLGVYAATEGEG